MTNNLLASLAVIAALAAWLWALRWMWMVARLHASMRKVAFVGGLTGIPLAVLIILWL
ncbi:MAG: hypothetical protein ACJ8BC_18930 [Gemmatimonadales bacterium]